MGDPGRFEVYLRRRFYFLLLTPVFTPWAESEGGRLMYAVVARLTALLGGDIDREYCLKMWDGYPKTSEPDLLYGYTKVPLGPRAGREADGEREGVERERVRCVV